MEGYHKNLNSFYATHPDDRPKNYNKQQKKNEKIWCFDQNVNL